MRNPWTCIFISLLLVSIIFHNQIYLVFSLAKTFFFANVTNRRYIGQDAIWALAIHIYYLRVIVLLK